MTFNTNFVGALYTIRLAHHYLRHNNHRTSTIATNSTSGTITPGTDRHILLLGSFASFLSSPAIPLYAASKHGLLGLLASLRTTSPAAHRIRFNLVAPYFIATPLLPSSVRVLLAGQALVALPHVTACIVRLCVDQRVAGRVLAVGPEGYAADVDIGGGLESIETFARRVVKVLNARYWGSGWWERWGAFLRDILIVVVGWIGLFVLGKLRGLKEWER